MDKYGSVETAGGSSSGGIERCEGDGEHRSGPHPSGEYPSERKRWVLSSHELERSENGDGFPHEDEGVLKGTV